jgi:hypothetical protein
LAFHRRAFLCTTPQLDLGVGSNWQSTLTFSGKRSCSLARNPILDQDPSEPDR